ncbi:MAG: 7-cyano-7-deazaguanine synthase, partial [Alphaproteobacteria bacterium]|nr:7-cyano-7-deazaguanine synthase [Alphaproteobacteria bacterium]
MQNLLEKYKLEDKVIAVGVSGGADSLALVLTAKEQLEPLGKKIVALTVDHGLRPHSAQEAQYVAQVMTRFGIEHHILKWN